MESQIKTVLRAAILTDFPTCKCNYKSSCSVCGKNACCTVGIECDHPDHPVKHYGNSILQCNYCPECSYVVSLVDRPDLGSPLWCTNCVKKYESK